MTPKQILIKAREHISDPSMWFQGGWSKRGSEGAREGLPCCMRGAIEWVWAEGSCTYDEMHGAESAVRAVIGQHSMPDFNDDPNTTHQDVLDIFDKAIEVAE